MRTFEIGIELPVMTAREIRQLLAIQAEILGNEMDRRQVADVVFTNGFEAHVGGRHVAILKRDGLTNFPTRVGIITHPTFNDWN
mgnify:FL=1